MRISDWSSDVCSSDLRFEIGIVPALKRYAAGNIKIPDRNRFEIEFSAPNMRLAGVERRRAAHDDLGYLQVGVIIVKRADVDPESSAEPFCLGASFGDRKSTRLNSSH